MSITATEANDATEPVTLSEAKAWANIDHTDDDGLVTEILKGSRYDIEQYTGRKLVSHQVTCLVSVSSEERFTLPYGKPANVLLFDENDVAIDTDLYKATGSSLKISEPGTYKITYTVGESSTALNGLIKMLTAYRYNNRGDGEGSLPEDIQQRAVKHQLAWL